MKTLKRSLALVLALVMVLGVMSISAGAAFDDAEEIQYDEAVDVLVGLNAINGYPDGSFRPDGSVKRSEACKMIAYVLLGESAAERLTCQSAPFDDVSMTYWAAPYIAYCVSQGIIQGYGDGTFGPENTVTGIQLGTMLLRALGYGQNDEYTGRYWDVNAVADANRLGLFTDSLATNYAAPATREETALYIFNTLPVETVAYSELFKEYVGSNTTLAASLQLAKVDKVNNVAVTDAYGYLGHYWTKNNIAITGVFADETPAVTYVGGQTVPVNTKANASVEYWINGVQKANITPTDIQNFKVPYGATASLILDATGAVKKVVATVEYAAVVTEVYPATATAKRTVDIKVFSDAGDYTISKYETDNFAKGEVLVVMPKGDNSAAKSFVSIAAAEKVTGQFTAYTGTAAAYATMRVGSTYYNVNDNYEIVVPSFAAGSTADFYLDTAGNIVYVANVNTAEVALNYVYVDASQSQAADPGDLIGSAQQAQFKASIINMDGSTAVVDVATFVDTDGVTKYMAPGTASATPVNTKEQVKDLTNPIAPGFYSYTVDANGAYIFTALDTDLTSTPTSVTVTKNSATVTNVANAYANSRTNLTVINKDLTTKVTGIANFTTTTYTVAGNLKGILCIEDKGAITDIVIVNKAAAEITTAPTYAYYVGVGQFVYGEGQYYNFFVNGKLESYVMASAPTGADSDYPIYTLTLTNGIGSATPVASGDLVKKVQVTAVDQTYFIANNTVVYYDAVVGCPVYNVTTGQTGAADVVEVNDYVTYVKDAEGNAQAVYIVNA